MNKLEKKILRGLLFGKLSSIIDDIKFYVNSIYSNKELEKEDADIIEDLVEVRKKLKQIKDKISIQ